MSFFDMIPEQEGVLPQTGRKGCASMSKKGFNLITAQCAWCGEEFTRRKGAVVYQVLKDGRLKQFCTWSHKCRYAETHPARKKGGCTKTTQEMIAERLEKIETTRAIMKEKGEQLTGTEKTRLVNRLQRLHKEVKALREELGDENNGSMRGIAGGDH